MFALLGIAATVSAVVLGFSKTRDFVRSRLRYVEAVHRASAPIKAGGVALLAATPVVWALPVIGAGTAILFGASVAAGVVYGSRDIRRKLPGF